MGHPETTKGEQNDPLANECRVTEWIGWGYLTMTELQLLMNTPSSTYIIMSKGTELHTL